MPRILFLYTGLGVGGAEHHLALLVARLPERGFEPMVATLRVRGRYFYEVRQAGIAIAHVGMRSRTDIRGMLRAVRLSKARPEIVVTRSIDAQLVGVALARRAGAAHITIEQGGPGLGSHRKRHHRLAGRLVAPRVDRVIAVTGTQAPDLKRLGYRSEAVRIVPNAVAEPVPRRPASAVRTELGVGPEDVLVLLVAALRPEKRPDRFIDAVAVARLRDPRVRGVIAGGGPREAAMRSHAMAVDGTVLVLGERSDVPDLIAAADVVCLSSDVEGIPHSLLEAMALAKPVVATDVGGVGDVVESGATGLLAPRDDLDAFAGAILELAGDPARARTLGEAGRSRFSEHFTVDRMVDGYAAVFSEVLGEARRKKRRRRIA